MYYHKKKTFIEIEHKNRSINSGNIYGNLFTLRQIFKSNKNLRPLIKNKLLSDTYFEIARKNIHINKNLKACEYLIKSIIIQIKNPQNAHKILLLLSISNIAKRNLKNQYR